MELQDTKILEMNHISKQYPGVLALNDVTFDLRAGEVHGLVGGNGAGKSTLIKCLMGITNKTAGTVIIDGQEVNISSASQAKQHGVSAVFQELSQVNALSVAENMYLGEEKKEGAFALNRKAIYRNAKNMFEKYEIPLDPYAKLGDLSPAKKQLAEIAKALSCDPKIVIFDEPTSALTETEEAILFRLIGDLKAKGCGIIYITHRMNELFKIADRITVFKDGCLVGTKPMEGMTLEEIVRMMVGQDTAIYDHDTGKIPSSEKETAFEAKNLCLNGMFKDISFQVKKGEVLGFAGLEGSGRSEIVEMIFGITPPDSGEMTLNGEDICVKNVRDAMASGIALVPESRHREGLVLKHSIEANMTLAVLPKFTKGLIVDKKNAIKFVNGCIKQYEIKTESPKKVVNFLSGGNQQKVVVAKWLGTEPKLLILDEPTAGIDIHTKSEIHRIVRDLAEKEGLAVILISSEMPELLANSDRVLVINNKRIIGEFEHTNQEEIMTLIMEDNLTNKAAN